jgi:hypothetical protein
MQRFAGGEKNGYYQHNDPTNIGKILLFEPIREFKLPDWLKPSINAFY